MTKIRLKNYLKIGGLLLSMLFIISACQDESFNNHQETIYEKRLKRITLNELNSRIGNSEGYSKLSAMFDVNKSKATNYQQRLESSNNPYILTDEIVMIEKDNMTFYTFKIESDATGSQFYNLVVAMDEFNSIRSTRILEYTPSEYWLQDTSQPFNGTVKIQDNDIFSITDINTMFFARGSNQCVSGVTGEWQCGANQNHEPGHPNCTSENNAVTQYIITVHWGPCPNEITQGDSGDGGGDSFPIDGGNTGGGTTSSTTGNNNNNGNPPDLGENCIVDSNGNCLIDETTPLLVVLGRNRECKKISDLLEQYPAYKTKLLQLASEASNATFEKGVALDKNGNDINIPDGVAGKIEPPLNPTEKYMSIAHIHDSQGDEGNGTFSVPSLNDIANLGYISVINDKVNLDKMVYFVFTADGTYYALTINSHNKFKAFWAYQKLLHGNSTSLTYEQRDEYLKTLEDRAQPNNNGIYHKYYNNKNGSLIDETSTDYEQQLKYFLQFLQEENGMGVSMFETDVQLSYFKEVKLNESSQYGTPQRNDCE